MKDLRLLLLATNYPRPEANTSLTYIRTRNLYYKSHGVQIEVINFMTSEGYQMDGIDIHPLSWFSKEKAKDFDMLICHAPNLRNHYLFLRKYAKLFKKIIFFYHGHEVLKINKVYSTPYSFMKQPKIRRLLQDVYDDFKLFLWRKYFQNNKDSSYCIYVSNWMRNEFFKWTKLSPSILTGHEFITYNSVGEVFENRAYCSDSDKKYDFITIRSFLDGSKYCVDIVNDLAFNNPNLKFLLIGKGRFFDHYRKAPNITWIDTMMNHQEMCDYMDMAKCALMPTRTDAQGVMMCEMSAFGMPVITSNIPVCHEVFDGVPGIGFIDNERPLDIPIVQIYNEIKNDAKKSSKYDYSVVCAQELSIIKSISES